MVKYASMNILLVEDDMDLGNGVRIALADQGWNVTWVRSLADGLAAVEEAARDLLVLDLTLPDGDGLELLLRLRRRRDKLPVLVLSARDALDDRLRGLDSGADDYLVKPFALAELLSRLRALLRRSLDLHDGTLSVRELAVHEATRRVTVGGAPVELSRCEFELLVMLMKRCDRIVTRRVLEEQVLPGGLSTSNALDVHMSNLRRKIGEGYVRTVRGVGFVIDAAPPCGA